MEWKAGYETGIQEIDDHHKTILGFINEFEAAASQKQHWNAVQPLLVRTREFARFHFAVEESLMQIINYPMFAAHRSEHRHILVQIESLEIGVLRQDLKEELLPLMRNWLIGHMVESDLHFTRYAMARYRDADDAVEEREAQTGLNLSRQGLPPGRP